MSGEMVYVVPAGHRCDTSDTSDASGAVGSVWRCGACGAYWRMDALPLVAFAAWHPMGRFAVWRWKRRHQEAP